MAERKPLVFDGGLRRLPDGDSMPLVLTSYTVGGGLPSVSPAGQMIYVTDESGGAVPAFSDGTDWRRVTDRAVVS
jgi:hypothetical protein